MDGGFVLYLLLGGTWTPLKLVDTNDTPSIADDTIQNLVGSVQDDGSANTINGAKAYAEAIGTELVGDPTDAATNMTLYGLKNYIDAQIEALG